MPSLSTTAVHAGRLTPRPGTPSAPPIVTASGWAYDDMQALDAALGDPAAGFAYARSGAPTQEALEAAMAALEGGQGAAAFASGMAALNAALLSAAGERATGFVAARELYGTTQTLIKHLAQQTGTPAHFVNVQDLDAVRAALAAAGPGAVFLFEVLSNPLCRVADVAALIDLARAAGARTVVDSTFTTPCLIRPLEHGADFVVHSATKYIGGHGDVLAGLVVAARAEDAARLLKLRNLLGANLSPFDAYLALRGLRTLPLRVREANRTAARLAAWLAEHPRVSQVYYPGLPANPGHALAQRQFSECRFGAMLSFDLAEAGRAEVFAFLEKLRVIQRIATLGDVATLASYPAHASQRALTRDERLALGIGDGCVRLSVGIEDVDDLIADLAQALT
jgi:cystathionine gamma-synthase/methionine-gamma-lyase